MFTRLLNIPKNKSFFLFGPRGTGKSTWIRKQFQPVLTLDLLEAQIWQRLLARPGDLAALVDAVGPGPIAIDEVQRAPELLNEVHRLIERAGRVFALTGSSARKLRREGVNLLAGRALTLHMHPLTAQEQGPTFDLNKSLLYGHLPAIFSENYPRVDGIAINGFKQACKRDFPTA